MNTPNKLIVHHSGGTDLNPLEDTSHHTAAMIKAWHLAKGWDDIGYNWVIEKTGKVVKGRDEKKDGAHTLGQNSQSVGVCLSGNFDTTLPTKEQLESFEIFYRNLIKRYPNITPDKVFPHRKFANKTCYGRKIPDTFFSELAQKTLQTTIEVKDNTLECKILINKEENSLIDKIISFLNSLKK